MARIIQNSPPDWSRIHDEKTSWRRKTTGEISDAFFIPRYVRFFYSIYKDCSNCSFLELGAGTGELSRAILNDNKGQIGRYVVSEYFDEGVAWLKKVGLEAVKEDAMQISQEDQSFDVCVEFDIMHHVENPRKMAKEMMRVARGSCLLVESNGLSLFRKIKELTPAHRQAGERSYTPWAYRSFFEQHEGYKVTEMTIFPFLFPLPLSGMLLPLLIQFNILIEKIPFFRWACSSVAIHIKYDRV